MQVAIARTEDKPITIPNNSPGAYLETKMQGTMLALWDELTDVTSTKVEMHFSGWTKDSLLAILLPSDWTLIAPPIPPPPAPLPPPSPFAWSRVGNLWVAQILAATIQAIPVGVPLEVHFTLYDLVNRVGHDPVVVVHRDG
jgi:hypothetical protein